MKNLFALSLFGLFLFASAPLSAAQGTYTQIDAPGGVGDTALRGINSVGDICGYYDGHGFLLSGGSYITIDYPGFPVTQLFGLNDNGQIVGVAFGNGVDVGFVYNTADQTFTEISYPGSPTTIPQSINNTGEIAGVFYSQNERKTLGFEFDGSTYTKITAPKGFSAWAYGISASDDVVGVFSGPGAFNFVFHQGKYKLLGIPEAPGAVVTGIDSAGTTLVGFYGPVSGGVAGFVESKQGFEEVQFPGANETLSYGVNNAGEVVGYFSDPGLVTYHGFTWTPPAGNKK